MSEPLRVDVLLHRLCLTRSRSEAKAACDAGAVRVKGEPVKASYAVRPGEVIGIHFPHRVLEIQVGELPPKSISKKAARELYRVLKDEPAVDL